MLLESIDQVTGLSVGTFLVKNITGGGLEIISVNIADADNFTSAYSNLMVFYNFIVNSNNSINFSSNLVSEFQDTDVQNSNIPTLNLSSSISTSQCDSYLFNGSVLTSSGNYVGTFLTSSGCDSIVNLDLQINSSYFNTNSVSVCDSIIWNGISYYSTGVYYDTLSSQQGCDSILELNLSILSSGCTDPTATNYDPTAICDDNSCLYNTCSLALLDSSNVLCHGANDGYITVGGVGGAGVYHYSLQIYNSTFNYWQQIGQSPLGNNFTYANVTFPLLTAQCYQIVMDDPLGCRDTIQVCLTEPDPIQVFATVSPTSSSLVNDGSITIDSTIGGVPPYIYNWNGPFGFSSNSQNISNLQSGTYVLNLTDSNSCVYSQTFVVEALIPGCTDSTASNYNHLQILMIAVVVT